MGRPRLSPRRRLELSIPEELMERIDAHLGSSVRAVTPRSGAYSSFFVERATEFLNRLEGEGNALYKQMLENDE